MSDEIGVVLRHVMRLVDEQPVWALQARDTELGIWLTLAQANVEDEAMAQGIPVLRGPYVVDFTDIPHDGDTLVLWTPAAGDVLLRLFPDFQTLTQWDVGQLRVGQLRTSGLDYFAWADAGKIAIGDADGTLDSVVEGVTQEVAGNDGNYYKTTAFVFPTADPVQVQLTFTPGTDPTAGHVELYALVARAVAP